MSLRAVIFDLDGTLLDTLADIASAMNRTLESHGLPAHPVAAYRSFVGSGTRQLVIRAAGALADERLVDQLTEQMRSTYASNATVQTRAYEGVPELLDSLATRGTPFAVLSNKDDTTVQLIVRELLPDYNFRVVLGLRPGAPAKPDPTTALEVARQLGCEPSEVLYLGDSDVDMVTARRAGMYAAGAAWGFRGVHELQEAGADVVVNEPQEILTLLNGRQPS